MDIPTNDDDVFEVVDGEGVVHGRGTIVDGTIRFEFVVAPGPGGEVPPPINLSRAEFENTWPQLPQSRMLTIQAAP